MTHLEEHHNLALMLLAGRSLPDGLPWSYAEDRLLIARERTLWASLAEPERAQEQKMLTDLWRSPDRRVPVNPAWGPWAAILKGVTILDSAFGIPRHDFRPLPKGPPVEEHPGYTRIIQWFWDHGFQVVDLTPSGWLVILIPERRVVNEADRLVGLLAGAFPHVPIQPLGLAMGIQIRSVYDPVGGRAFVEVFGLDDFLAFSL